MESGVFVRSRGEPVSGRVIPRVSLATSDDCSSGNRAAQTATAQAPTTSRIEGTSVKMSVKIVDHAAAWTPVSVASICASRPNASMGSVQ